MEFAVDHQRGASIFVPNRIVHHPHPLNFINPNFGPQLVHHVNRSCWYGLHPFVFTRMELERSLSLQQVMNEEGLLPTPEEEARRRHVIQKLKEIVMKWIRRVAYQRRLPLTQIDAASATILTYGSYGLGVHNAESDIDALCVGPWFATLTEDFFIVLHDMLARRPEVSEIRCVKDAKVPLMRFKFEGISIDLPYARLKVTSFPEDVDILNPFFLMGINETSWKSLSGVRANKSILQLVPDVAIFQELLRCIKLWAKRRGVYGNLLGFFGGVHLAVLAAFICQRNPNARSATLISVFFKTFAHWPWPTPVIIQDGMMQPASPPDLRSLMPIQLPCSPQEYCYSNITKSTFNKIWVEFHRGYLMTQDLFKPSFDWRSLFEPYPYAKKYPRFVKICLSASNQDELGDWVGWVKSRFRCLLVKLEEAHTLCDPNPSEYVDTTLLEPNIVFYWGLVPGGSEFLNLSSIEEDFRKNLSTGHQGPCGRMSLSIVQASALPKNPQFEDQPGWRISNRSQQRVPLYSIHVPQCFVGYLAIDGSPKYPIAGNEGYV